MRVRGHARTIPAGPGNRPVTIRIMSRFLTLEAPCSATHRDFYDPGRLRVTARGVRHRIQTLATPLPGGPAQLRFLRPCLAPRITGSCSPNRHRIRRSKPSGSSRWRIPGPTVRVEPGTQRDLMDRRYPQGRKPHHLAHVCRSVGIKKTDKSCPAAEVRNNTASFPETTVQGQAPYYDIRPWRAISSTTRAVPSVPSQN